MLVVPGVVFCSGSFCPLLSSLCRCLQYEYGDVYLYFVRVLLYCSCAVCHVLFVGVPAGGLVLCRPYDSTIIILVPLLF